MLNDTQIRNLQSMEKPKKHFDGGGMYLLVATTGGKLWRMVYHFDRKEKLRNFGEFWLPSGTIVVSQEICVE